MKKEVKSKCGKLSACNLGSAIGLVWGLSMLLLGVLSISFNYATPVLRLLSGLYLGFHPSLLGCLVGLAWGFIHGFIAGILIATIYNYCRCCCPCTACKGDRCEI